MKVLFYGFLKYVLCLPTKLKSVLTASTLWPWMRNCEKGEKYWEEEGMLGLANNKLSQWVTSNLHSDTEVGLLLKQIRTFGKWAEKMSKGKTLPPVRHWSSSLPSKSPYLSWEAETGTNGKGRSKADRETEAATHRERREGVKLTAATEGGWSETITQKEGCWNGHVGGKRMLKVPRKWERPFPCCQNCCAPTIQMSRFLHHCKCDPDVSSRSVPNVSICLTQNKIIPKMYIHVLSFYHIVESGENTGCLSVSSILHLGGWCYWAVV